MKKVALVFSGGALRGFSQMGAYKAIEVFLKQNNAKITAVVGTSFGSVTAGLIALGFSSKQMIELSHESGLKLASLRDVKLKGAGILKPTRLRTELKKHIGDKTFADVKPRLVINSVDILTGKEFVFTKKGLLAADRSEEYLDKNIALIDAIVASCSIPGVFVPSQMFGKLLVDGGLANPIGLDLIDRRRYDFVIGVDVCMANFNFVTSKRPSMLQVVQQSISIAQRQFHFERVEKHIEDHPNIYIIRPNVGPVNKKNKNEMDRIIECGYIEAKKVLGV